MQIIAFEIIPAFMGCWALQELLGITVRNPLTVVLFVCLLWGYGYVRKFNWVKALGAGCLSAGTTFFTYKRVSAAYTSGIFRILSMAILFLGLLSLFYLILSLLIHKDGLKRRKLSLLSQPEKKSPFSGKKTLFIMMGFLLLCWMPYFLYEFPGIMTADSMVQYEQIIGIEPYSNHHPVVHTLLIKLFYELGLLLTGDREVAIAFYTVFQMIFMAVCCSFLIQHIKSRRWQIIALLFYALMPFNAVFAVTIWKDIIFSGVTMLLICLVLDMREKEQIPWLTWAGFVIISVLFALMRSNAWYAFIVWTLFLVIAFRKNLVKIVLSAAAVIFIVVMIKGPVMSLAGVTQPDFVESLSVPLQQVARCLVDEVEISDKERELIEDVIDTTYIKELYAPDFADNIKELARAGHPEVIENNKAEYLRLWAGIVLRHPVTAIKAWYDLEGGYIYPDVYVRVGDIDGVMGNDYGIFWNPLIGGPLVVKAKEILIKMGDFVPLYGMFFSIGAYSWLLILAMAVCLRKRKPLLCKILLLLQVGTLLIAAPVVDFRYGYSMVMTMPLWVYVGVISNYKYQDGKLSNGTNNR